MKRYFFNNEHNTVYDFDSDFHRIGTPAFKRLFTELTDKQRNFYLSFDGNKRKSLKRGEIESAQRFTPYVPTLEEYKQMKLSILDGLSTQTSDLIYPTLIRENARISLAVSDKRNRIYRPAKANHILNEYGRISALCREEYHRVSKLIKEATRIEEVDEAFISNKYNTFK